MAVVVALIIGAGIGYSGIAGNALTRTERITSNSTFTTVITSHENATRTITSMATSVSYSTITASTTQRMFTTVTRTVANTTLNWDGLIYLSNAPGCSWSQGNRSGYSPCWSYFSTDAISFNCISSAGTPQGCTQQVYVRGTTNESFTVTTWYPFSNSSAPIWANCKYSVPSEPVTPGSSGQAPAYCITTNSMTFIVTQPHYQVFVGTG